MEQDACDRDMNREVMLVGFGSSFALFSPHTGELRRLPTGCEYDLSCGEDGEPSLSAGDGAAPRAVADIMALKLERGDDGRVCVFGNPRRSFSPPRTCARRM